MTTIPEMLKKLDDMYIQEETLIKQSKTLLTQLNNIKLQYEQLQDDKDILQNMIMYTSNKQRRK